MSETRRPLATVRCIVFDIDDTLYLERDYVRSGLNAVGVWVQEQLRIENFSERAWKLFEEGIRGTIFDRTLESFGRATSPTTIKELVRVYRTHKPAIRLLPDAEKCMAHLQNKFRLAGITGGPLDSQQAKIRALGLTRWLSPILTLAELGQQITKRQARAFEEIESQTGLNGNECAYVADEPINDFVAPKILGWRTVRIRRHGSLHEQTPSGDNIDHEIASLNELRDLLPNAPKPLPDRQTRSGTRQVHAKQGGRKSTA